MNKPQGCLMCTSEIKDEEKEVTLTVDGITVFFCSVTCAEGSAQWVIAKAEEKRAEYDKLDRKVIGARMVSFGDTMKTTHRDHGDENA